MFKQHLLSKYHLAVAGKRVGKLYLFISPEKLALAVKSNLMKPLGSSQPMEMKKKYLHYKSDNDDYVFFGVSTTRNPNWKPNEPINDGYWSTIRLTLDGDKISTRYKVKSYNDFWKNPNFQKLKRNAEDEFYAQSEEKIITGKDGFKDWTKYLLAVDVLESAKEEFEKLNLNLKNVKFVKDFKR